MPARSSSTSEALLGLLTIEPMSGYDLGLVIRESIGHFWNESYGQIYPNLKRLAAEGLVASKRERQEGKPDRRIYSITAKGRERLAAWLAIPPQPEIPRNELLLKLFFGAQTDAEVLIGYVQVMVETHRALLEEFEKTEREIARQREYLDTPFWKIAARFGQIEMEAHLRWAEETLAQLNKLARKRRSPSKARTEKSHAGK
jgi:PadR family transcriptional regulator, regulatory protein AphA